MQYTVPQKFTSIKFDRAGGVRRYFYHGSMFRYERPQKGRLREFHQFGCECFGEPSVYEDASVILMINEIFSRLGIKTKLLINSLGDAASMGAYRQKLVKFLDAHEEQICEDCKRRKLTNPIRVLDSTLFPNWTLDDTDDTGAISEYFHNEKMLFTEQRDRKSVV